MGYAIETVGGVLTNAAATGAQALTALTGQSFSIRAAATNTTSILMDCAWANFQDAGDLRIRSPRLHDDVNAIRVAAGTGATPPLLNEYFDQALFSQDSLIVEAFFTTIATVSHISLAYFNVVYADIPGISANLRDWAGVQPNVKNYLSVPVSCTSSATAGQWGGGVAINSSVDVFKANTLYALIGYESPVAFSAFSIQGVDIGNLQLGGPGVVAPIETRRWFAQQATNLGQPYIPVINSQNKGTTNVFVSDRAVSTAYEISLIWAELSA